jgi:hypothetical protein
LRPLLPTLASNAQQRLADDPRHARHMKAVAHVRDIAQRTEVPLEYAARRSQFAAESELRRAEDDASPEAAPSVPERDAAASDLVLDAALQVLAELTDMQGGLGIRPGADGAIEVQDWLRRIFAP